MKQLIIALSLAAVAGACLARPAASSPASAAAAGEVATAAPGSPQRSKMKACNADAKARDLHHDERRAFMKQCLSKGKAAPAS